MSNLPTLRLSADYQSTTVVEPSAQRCNELTEATLFIENMGLATIVIPTGDRVGIPRGAISCTLDRRWYSPTPPLQVVARRILKLQLERAAKANRLLFDDTHYRLSGLSVGPERVEFRLEYCTYFDFVSTNLSLDLRMREVCPSWGDDRLRDRLGLTPDELERDPLCNQLGISISIVTLPDNRLLFSKRGRTVFAYPNGYANTVNGEVDINDVQDGRVSIYRTAIREAEEELGLQLAESNIEFLGLVRNPSTLQPILIGLAFSDMSAPEVIEHAKHAKDSFEHETLVAVDFEPDAVVQHIRNAGPLWIPQCAICCIFSLVKAYGLPAVLDCGSQNNTMSG